LATARRIALAAQGFTDPWPTGRPDRRHLRRVLSRVGLLQIDSVNVVVRSHYLPAFSRLGPYPMALLDRAAYVDRELFEYWGHEASLLPVAVQPLLRWRMERYGDLWSAGRRLTELRQRRPGYVEEVLAEITARGPLGAGQLAGTGDRGGSWWGWHDGKIATEYLFAAGLLSTAFRRGFERVYDLTERVLPPAVLAAPTPPKADAQRDLVRIAACALGIATETDLRDYFRLRPVDARARVAELVEAGELVPASVPGWRAPAYLHPGVAVPRRVRARALLSPFDSLVWDRARTERLFGFRFRLEIYTPAANRVHGYYVLPFLLDDRLVARVDVKADRAAGMLRVPAVWTEPAADAAAVAGPLAAELAELAGWLGLTRVGVGARGDLAAALTGALAEGSAATLEH
jgi:uncharacterized protein YcaQ